MAIDANHDANLWKHAYRHFFGTDPDQDKVEHAEEVEEWRIKWQAGFDAGEEWAMSMSAQDPSSSS